MERSVIAVLVLACLLIKGADCQRLSSTKEPHSTLPHPHISVYEHPTNNIFYTGQYLILICDSQFDNALFEFYKDGIKLTTHHHYKPYLHNLTTTDSGQYSCRIVLNKESAWSYNSVDITVKKRLDGEPAPILQPPSIYIYNNNNEVIYDIASLNSGESARIVCDAPHSPANTIYEFVKNTRIMQTNNGKEHYIISLKPSDAGDYYCVMHWNETETRSYNFMELSVTETPAHPNTKLPTTTKATTQNESTIQPPRITLHHPWTNFTAGASVHLSCETPSLLPEGALFTFWRGDTFLFSTPDKYGNIPNVQPYDSGKYWCYIEFSNRPRIKSFNTISINITSRHVDLANSTYVPPATPRIVLHSNANFFYEGAGVHLSCEAPGYDSYKFGFSRDGTTVSQGGNNLYLRNLKLSDSGEYTCSVLMVYSKMKSWNKIHIEVRRYDMGPTDQGEYLSGGASLVSCSILTALLFSLFVVLTSF